MTPLSVTRTSIEGFEGFHVLNGLVELTIVPELGGKISSLRDVRTGREWLWRHPRFAYKRVPYGSSYVKTADTGGWDECFPSVAECVYPSTPWQGAAIQDHGELWSQAAEFEMDERADKVTLLTRWHGIALPYTFTRTVTIAADSAIIHVDYEVTNDSEQPINYIWSIHPLLAIEPGMELRLPPAARFNVGVAFPANLGIPEENLKYPFSVDGLNFPILPEASAGVAIKIWSDPLPADGGWATVHARDGALNMRWDVRLLPQVAAWMNFGAWSYDGGAPYFNLGLEACIGAQDSLADAVTQHNLFQTVSPHLPKTWWLEIELTT